MPASIIFHATRPTPPPAVGSWLSHGSTVSKVLEVHGARARVQPHDHDPRDNKLRLGHRPAAVVQLAQCAVAQVQEEPLKCGKVDTVCSHPEAPSP